jgi:ribonuclease T1
MLYKIKGENSMKQRILTGSAILLLFLTGLFLRTQAYAESCEKAVQAVNMRLSTGIDEQELIGILRNLNRTKYKRLPPTFVNKQEARSQGWKPGMDLWSVSTLRGSSIGGDHFKNLEGRLPDKKWREADLDYKGGHRGGKRLIFSREGERFVTVDHYKTFREVPACR